MASMCNVNAILWGHLDYYCLVCEDLFKNIEDVEQHVETSHHQNMLQKTAYAVDYEEHRIRKLKKGYFCEYCNDAFTTMAKMRFHIIIDEKHIYRKNHNEFDSPRSVLNAEWVGNKVLASELLIDEKPWNGILEDNTCLVCDEEIESLEDHKKQWSHALKILHTRLIIGKNEFTRQIDDSLRQCLVCNEVIQTDDFDTHTNTESHMANYFSALCCTADTCTATFKKVVNDAITDKNGQVSTKDTNTINNITLDDENVTKVKQVQKQAKPAFLKGNDESIANKECANKASATEVKKTINASVKQDNQFTSDGEETPQSFAKSNDMSIKDDKAVYCNVCNVKVPFILRNMKEHVNGYTHSMTKRNLNLSNASSAQERKTKDEKSSCSTAKNDKKCAEKIKPYKTQPFHTFLQSRISQKSITGEIHLVLNYEIYVPFVAFITFKGYVTFLTDRAQTNEKSPYCRSSGLDGAIGKAS